MKTLARDACRQELLDRLARIRPDSARRWGRMSVHQMVCHVTDTCRMMTGETAVSPASSLLQRTLIKWIALYAPLQWPLGIQTRPELDQDVTGASPRDFAADLAALQALLAVLAPGDRTPRHHPIFGRMSDAAWMRWAYLHTDHHLRQFGA